MGTGTGLGTGADTGAGAGAAQRTFDGSESYRTLVVPASPSPAHGNVNASMEPWYRGND